MLIHKTYKINNNFMKISVVTIVFNDKNNIERTITNIISQTARDNI